MKTLLVTGTSSGIGLATAVRAAAAGWRVVATMREPDRAGALLEAVGGAGVEVDVRRLDVTDAGSVEACLSSVAAGYGGLDALVNNAGVSNFDPTMEMSTMAALRANLEVNFFGVIAVSRVAMPLLRARGGRLISIGSIHGAVGQPFNEAYAAAKFAVEGFMESLAPVAAAHGVAVSIVVPGFVHDTDFGRFPDINRTTIRAASGPYAETFDNHIAWLSGPGWEGVGQSRWEVADVVVSALGAADPPFRIPTSDWVADYLRRKYADLDGSAVQTAARSWISAPSVPLVEEVALATVSKPRDYA
ncbi:SDR family NAD(P)-dependent oxidoreductase [Nocardioides speluncae]|uniref:SDR family NAD(P)-dependent oxidoreductase n=1 Tax=Nocardioides speluncae TaxID=2670337 RepID=UPI000D69FB35|nr:SDR family NAD(P)-dependent oxidoreductase [Nocardioides speluncae]